MPCSSELLVSMDIPSTSIELSMLFSGLKGVLDPLLLFNRLLDVSILAKCMSIMGYEILNRFKSSLLLKILWYRSKTSRPHKHKLIMNWNIPLTGKINQCGRCKYYTYSIFCKLVNLAPCPQFQISLLKSCVLANKLLPEKSVTSR